MKKNVLDLLTRKGSKTDLQLGFRSESTLNIDFNVVMNHFGCALIVIDVEISFLFNKNVIRKPAVIMIVGVNGGGKTTSLGKKNTLALDLTCCHIT